MVVGIPAGATPFEYVVFVLSVTLTTLGLLTLGGVVKWFFGRHKAYPTFRKKFWLFPLFVVGIFVMGWVSAQAQQLMYLYLKQNVVTSVTGFAAALLVAWFLYDWAIWRSSR
jgi:hypothetical protein